MNKYKTVWISDIHLGTRGCKSDNLLEFLKNIECENLYLVGDIIDGWRMKKGFYFPNKHVKIIKRILKLSKTTNIFYVIGNHDSFIRPYTEYDLMIGNNILINDEFEYNTINGQKLLVTHGDKYDIITSYHTWIANIGDSAYTLSLMLNTVLNDIRAKFGFPYWSLSNYLKSGVKSALNFILEYEVSLTNHAKNNGYDGVICGHIHHAEIKIINDVHYYNTGDWVESCSALVEEFDGTIKLIDFATITKRVNKK